MSTLLLGAGLWFVRFSIAEFFLGAALAERGAEADFQVINLDWDGAALANVRFGSEASPDAAIPLIEARWRWRGMTPHVHFVRLVRPRLHLSLDERGAVSAGALDRLGSGAPSRRRLSIPHIELEVLEGRATLDAPFGELSAQFEASGTLGQDFLASGRLQRTSRPGDHFSLTAVQGDFSAASSGENLDIRINADADAMVWNDARIEAPSIAVTARAPLDLARYDVEATWRASTLDYAGLSASALTGAVGGEATTRATTLSPQDWAGELRFQAATFAAAGATAQHLQFRGRVEGSDANGRGGWSASAAQFSGMALISAHPHAEGAFQVSLGEEATLTGAANIGLERARLTPPAQARLRAAFPDLNGAPVGPAFAQARRALDAAAGRFDLAVPLRIDIEGGRTFVRVVSPATARAASGAALRLSPLRQDAPALVLQWPGPALHGAISLELSGGGAPTAALLLDTADWSPEAPLEADGTLSLSNWRAANSSISTEEINVSVAVQPGGGGRIDVRGPLELSGPLGEGEVRNVTSALDLGVQWGAGWRVTSNSACQPLRLGGVEAAGLSFTNGAFELCPLNGALIAADAAGNLSGGFTVRRLALNGRMSGEGAQPAQLTAADIVGRFSGRPRDIALALEAASPRLAIQMSEQRTLEVAMRRVTAEARIADTWRVEGAFEQGTLTDPALPGSVSTIAGAWSAAPQDGEAVLQVIAGEAALTANRPATDAERPLFNPLRLVDVNGELRAGRITANGAILLEEGARQLAHFTARHEVAAGEGAANVNAAEIQFGPALQPYEITERARGLVDNVRGPIAVNADISWTREAIRGQGDVRLNGLSLATATIPIVNGVRGDVFFDDIFALTTPPGQAVTIEELNPGVAVRDGHVRFQLLGEQRVAIEQAEFSFASGVLAMSPATIELGADKTRFELTLRDVDAASLLQSLNVPDLAATGQVEGSFPLLLTRRSAYVEGGMLRAQGAGGVISYTGNAGAGSTGPARIAFDALRSFRYDTLSLTLDGDLNGEVVSSIAFSGENSGRPVDLGPIAPVPGVGSVTVRGVPFRFNVHVSAPFRRLAQTAASIADPGALVRRARDGEPQEAVDPEPAPQR
ncbi:MAG: YdbH domain-containing protein [Hyphomonadaceae bacterium]